MRMRTITVLVVLAAALPARAALVLEYIQVSSITAPLSSGPALTSLSMVEGGVTFLQVALRDTLGSGPEYGQPSTVPWQTNGGNAGPGSLGIGTFFVRFDGVPLVAVNPLPQNNFNARLVDQVSYGLITVGSMPPTFTNIGGLLNFGSEPGAVPNPAAQNRIALFNLRVTALGTGSGSFRLRDPNPAPPAVDNSLLLKTHLIRWPPAFSRSTI